MFLSAAGLAHGFAIVCLFVLNFNALLFLNKSIFAGKITDLFLRSTVLFLSISEVMYAETEPEKAKMTNSRPGQWYFKFWSFPNYRLRNIFFKVLKRPLPAPCPGSAATLRGETGWDMLAPAHLPLKLGHCYTCFKNNMGIILRLFFVFFFKPTATNLSLSLLRIFLKHNLLWPQSSLLHGRPQLFVVLFPISALLNGIAIYIFSINLCKNLVISLG